MRTIRCNRCKQMFEYDRMLPPCCPACQKQENENFEKVRKLIRERPNVTVTDAHEITGVPVEAILRYIDDDLLEATSAKNIDELMDNHISVLKERARKQKTDQA